jgi:hypothetical protein
MSTLLIFAVVQALNLFVLAWFNRMARFRILALGQQLGVYKRKTNKPRLRSSDRLFRSLLCTIWRDWSSELILVRPETVIRWRKRKFQEFWRRKSKGKILSSWFPLDCSFRGLSGRSLDQAKRWCNWSSTKTSWIDPRVVIVYR